jgi:hypothetical protein
MAQKKIDIKFNLDSKSVQIAGEETMKMTQQVRLLKAELASGKYSQEEFDILSTKLDDVQDKMEKTKLRTGDLFTTLQLLPGPIGEISSKFNGAIALLNSFTDFSFADLQTQFKKTIDDVKDIGAALSKNLGITKIYETLNQALARGFVAVGIGEQAAAAGARSFAAALTATGIGAIVVGLGLLIANWEEVTDAIKGATAETKTYDEAQADVTKNLAEFNKKLFDVKNAFAQARSGAISKEDALKKYNDELGKSVGFAGSLEQAEELLASNTKVVVEGIKLRTQAQVFYAKSAEAAAKAVSGEDIDPTFWQSVGDYILAGGQYAAFANRQVETYAQNLQETKKSVDVFAKEGDKLTQQAIENDAKLKKGLATPPDTTKTKEAVKSTYDETKKAIEDARLFLMDEQKREEEIVSTKYANLIEQAKKNGLETKTLMEAQAKEEKAIEDKYQKIKDDKEKQQLQKEQGFQNELSKINAQRTETLKDDTDVEIELVNQKYDALITAAKANKEDTATLEKLKVAEIEKIRKEGQQKETERIATEALEARQQKLALLQLEGEALIQGTKSYAENRAEILRLTEESILIELKRQLDTGKITREQYEQAITATEAKYTQQRKDLKQQEVAALGQTISATIDAVAGLGNAIASSYDEEAKTSKSAFEKRKKLQVATALMSAASGLVQILTQPSTLPSPLDVIVKTANAAALGIATAGNISKIKAVKFEAPDGGDDAASKTPKPINVVATRNQGGFVYGNGGSITDSIPAMLSDGEFVMNAKSSSLFSPMLMAMNSMGNLPNTSLPKAPGNQSLVDIMSQNTNNRPIKTYVTAQDMSNQQQFDRTIKSRSLI